MKAKGTAIRVLPEFIKEKYPAIYNDWLRSLSPESYEIFSKPIYPSQWFEIAIAHSYPTKILADLVGEKSEDLAEKIGQYSAESALKGIYSIFLKLASLRFTFNRIKEFFKTYYSPIEFELLDSGDNFVKFKFGYTTEDENLLYYRNKGWGIKLIELSLHINNPYFEFDIISHDNNLYYAIFTAKW